jgi:hypothetical protein
MRVLEGARLLAWVQTKSGRLDAGPPGAAKSKAAIPDSRFPIPDSRAYSIGR